MAGELLTGEFMIEFNGWAGAVRDLVGVKGYGSLRNGDIERARAHGNVPGPQFSTERVITATVPLFGSTLSDLEQAMDAALVVRSDELPLLWRLRGAEVRRVDARVREFAMAVDRDYSIGVSRAIIQFVASDPRIYANDLRSASTGVGSVTGGQGFPLSFPHGFGTATAGTITAQNDGTSPAPWVATLTGPLTSPFIDLVGADGLLAFAGFELAAGETLVIDSLARTVLLGGTTSRFSALTTRDWFDLPPGSSTVGLGAVSGSGSLSLAWRDTYL